MSETVSAEVVGRLRQQLRAQRGGGQVQGGGGLSNLWDGNLVIEETCFSIRIQRIRVYC